MTKEKEEVVQLFNELLTCLSQFQETKFIHLEMKMVENNSSAWWPESLPGPFCIVSSEMGQLLLKKTTVWTFYFLISTPPTNQPSHLPAKENRQTIQNITEKQAKIKTPKTNPNETKTPNPNQWKSKKPNLTAAVLHILYPQVDWIGQADVMEVCS